MDEAALAGHCNRSVGEAALVGHCLALCHFIDFRLRACGQRTLLRVGESTRICVRACLRNGLKQSGCLLPSFLFSLALPFFRYEDLQEELAETKAELRNVKRQLREAARGGDTPLLRGGGTAAGAQEVRHLSTPDNTFRILIIPFES